MLFLNNFGIAFCLSFDNQTSKAWESVKKKLENFTLKGLFDAVELGSRLETLP